MIKELQINVVILFLITISFLLDYSNSLECIELRTVRNKARSSVDLNYKAGCFADGINCSFCNYCCCSKCSVQVEGIWKCEKCGENNSTTSGIEEYQKNDLIPSLEDIPSPLYSKKNGRNGKNEKNEKNEKFEKKDKNNRMEKNSRHQDHYPKSTTTAPKKNSPSQESRHSQTSTPVAVPDDFTNVTPEIKKQDPTEVEQISIDNLDDLGSVTLDVNNGNKSNPSMDDSFHGKENDSNQTTKVDEEINDKGEPNHLSKSNQENENNRDSPFKHQKGESEGKLENSRVAGTKRVGSVMLTVGAGIVVVLGSLFALHLRKKRHNGNKDSFHLIRKDNDKGQGDPTMKAPTMPSNVSSCMSPISRPSSSIPRPPSFHNPSSFANRSSYRYSTSEQGVDDFSQIDCSKPQLLEQECATINSEHTINQSYGQKTEFSVRDHINALNSTSRFAQHGSINHKKISKGYSGTVGILNNESLQEKHNNLPGILEDKNKTLKSIDSTTKSKDNSVVYKGKPIKSKDNNMTSTDDTLESKSTTWKSQNDNLKSTNKLMESKTIDSMENRMQSKTIVSKDFTMESKETIESREKEMTMKDSNMKATNSKMESVENSMESQPNSEVDRQKLPSTSTLQKTNQLNSTIGDTSYNEVDFNAASKRTPFGLVSQAEAEGKTNFNTNEVNTSQLSEDLVSNRSNDDTHARIPHNQSQNSTTIHSKDFTSESIPTISSEIETTLDRSTTETAEVISLSHLTLNSKASKMNSPTLSPTYNEELPSNQESKVVSTLFLESDVKGSAGTSNQGITKQSHASTMMGVSEWKRLSPESSRSIAMSSSIISPDGRTSSVNDNFCPKISSEYIHEARTTLDVFGESMLGTQSSYQRSSSGVEF